MSFAAQGISMRLSSVISGSFIGIATLATASAALISSIVAIASFRASKESLSADLCMRLEDRFDSDDIKSRRCAAAKSLLAQENMGEAEDVLDFFESVGLLVRLKASNLEMAYNSFFHWVNTYWNAARGHIESQRKRRRTVWRELEYLYQETIKVERKRDSSSIDLAPTPEIIKGYLKDEENLDNN
jgi:hypothetical protein